QIRVERAKKTSTPGQPRKTASPPSGARREPPPLPGEPPDFPPLHYDEPPPEEDLPFEVVTARPAPVRRSRPLHEDAPMEAYCLKVLLREPAAYYTVNRRLKEIIEKNAEQTHVATYRQVLLDGPLAEWGIDDFRHTDGRAVMQLFLEALNQ